jgi:hypothetical protein
LDRKGDKVPSALPAPPTRPESASRLDQLRPLSSSRSRTRGVQIAGDDIVPLRFGVRVIT